jgi:ribosomal protein S18 acetylase RimI-like enzyme
VDLPAGHAFRRATDDDVHDIWALVCAVDVEEYGVPDYDESDVRDDFARDRFSLDRDTWLVHGPGGELVAAAFAWDKEPHALLMGDSAVHPDAPDLYPWLVERMCERAVEHAAVSGRCVAHFYNSAPNARRGVALAGAGFEPVRVFRRMEAALGGAADPRDPRVRPAAPDELRVVWEVQQASFADHYDFVPTPYDAWHRMLVASESYRPDLWWVAVAGGAVAGVLIGQAHDDKGWVKTVGVLPQARGQGLASALLRTAFARFRDLGYDRAGLGVDSDNTTGAMALYERLGMTATHRYDLYERVFTGS